MNTALNFDILENGNCKTLTVIDTSIYAPGQATSQAKLTLYAPGTTQFVEIDMLPRKVNVFNSNNLNLSCADTIDGLLVLNDGVYKAIYSIVPADELFVEKTFLRACQLRCKYNSVLLALAPPNCEGDPRRGYKLNKLKEIDFMIECAYAAARKCNMKLALDLYRQADKELSRLGGSCD